MNEQESIQDRIQSVQERIRKACVSSGRSPESVQLVLVTKTVPPERIREAIEAGALDLGENRVQELIEKKPVLPAGVRWHMIGHLQTNKVKFVAGETVLIHSLDRLELVEALEKQALKKGIEKIDCLVQINSSGEASKSGEAPDRVNSLIEKIRDDSPVKIKGLMTIGPLTGDTQKIREAFRLMKRLQTDLAARFPLKSWDILSMGMSGDYEIAIEEGATLVRVGSAVFGARI